eukprot:tig00000767_g3955.t1
MTAPGNSDATASEPAGLLSLPADVLHGVFELLGPVEAQRIRAVSVALRAAVDSVVWRSPAIRVRGARAVASLERRVRFGRLRATGASLAVAGGFGPQLQPGEPAAGGGPGPVRRPAFDLLRACGDPASAFGLRSVWLEAGPGEDVDAGSLALTALSRLAGAAAAGLEQLEIVCEECSADGAELESLGPELRGALAPFPALSALRLPGGALLAPEGAAALAAALPRLRSLAARVSGGSCLAALGDRSSLQELELLGRRALPGRFEADPAGPGFAALASSPAGPSLRRLRVSCTPHVFWWPEALGSFPALEDLEIVSGGWGPSSNPACIASLPRLRRLSVHMEHRTPHDRAWGLARALAALPSLPRFDYSVRSLAPPEALEAVPESVVEVVEAARAPLRRLRLESPGPLRLAESSAVAKCENAERVELEHACGALAHADAYRFLHRLSCGKGLSVRVRVPPGLEAPFADRVRSLVPGADVCCTPDGT